MTSAVFDDALSHDSHGRADIVRQLEAVHELAVSYWGQYDDDQFFAPLGVAWSPAEQVRHLTRSMTPLLPVLRLPKLALRLLFGRSHASSATLGALRVRYQRALDAGGQAGKYAPTPETGSGRPRRNAIMDAHSETIRGLTAAMARWSDEELDSYRLPHPLLGKLTVREMLLFTVLHNEHHVAVAERRRMEAGIQVASA